MGAACACTSPTTVDGGVLTLGRSSNGFCTKGNPVERIQNGDMVACTSGQPRVMPGGDGDGGLGLLVEGARTNSAIRSQEFQNSGAWTTSGTVSLTVTADQAVAPDGTTTADRIQIAAASITDFAGLTQGAGSATGTADAYSVYLRGVSGSGTVYLIRNAGTCQACSYVSTSWTRCRFVTTTTGTSTVMLGVDPAQAVSSCASGATSALDFYAWGFQVERAASYVTSYVPTTSAAAARATEAQPSLPLVFGAGTGASIALTIVPYVNPTTGTWLGFSTAGNVGNPDIMGRFSGGVSSCYMRAAGGDLTVAGSWTADTENRLVCTTGRLARLNGTSNTGSTTTLFAGTTLLAFGDSPFGATVDGVYKAVCASPDAGVCR
jgi:hypothetical protein